MDKDKPTDITEEKIENLADPEASAIFREAFYAEGKALEEEAQAHPFAVDEEQKEALRRRILEAASADTESAAEEDPLPNTSDRKETNRKKRRFSPALRWAAVVVLACVGVLGVSMTSQARGSGLWSSIQRLIGVETRWKQEDNGADRNISNPEEYKAVEEITKKLKIKVPEFFYWPGEIRFEEFEINELVNCFMMIYTDGIKSFYFEGWNGESDISATDVWKGAGNVSQIEYDGVIYTITEVESDVGDTFYYVEWGVGECKFLLSGIAERNEIEKILKNIKN